MVSVVGHAVKCVRRHSSMATASLQLPEQFAIAMRRSAARALGVRSWIERLRDAGDRPAGMRRRSRRAPSGSASSRSRQRSTAAKRAFSSFGPLAHRSSAAWTGDGVDVAHQLADVLDLPAAALVRADAARLQRWRRPGARAGRAPRGAADRARPAPRPGPAAHASHACAGSSTARLGGVVGAAVLLVGSGDHSVGRMRRNGVPAHGRLL